ncbi:hypothetical protein K466DRAFT_614166 [Polyporus arcularius HHB13444]|uniref:DUF6533 domain-containing protein n=1 Tax=Polyporus arcularius HHB13444 TaxID=1314778 RepID=A0A5C3NN49_9APHY|nr:hypothetical protein K466DRAFT_614166 [Polyporus arcularius HHB13444]
MLSLVIVLFIYDTFLTFDQEVAYFWTIKRISGAALLFFANKWISMIVYVISLVDFASFPSDKVRYGYQESGENFPPFGCLETENTTAALNLRFGIFITIISRVPLIAADIILIYITWTTLRGSATLTDIHKSKRLTLSDVLFRGGTIYFVILFIMNVLHLTFSATAVSINLSCISYLSFTHTTYIHRITSILISRFLLELQEANHTVVKLDTDNPLHSSRNAWDSTPSFISSLGGFINPSRSAQSVDDGGIELQDCSPSEALGEEEGEVLAEVVPEAAASSSSTV